MVESSNHKLQDTILKHLGEKNTIDDTLQYAASLNITHEELDKSLKSLVADEYVTLQVVEKKLVELTDEGASYAERGTPEYQYASVLEMGKPVKKGDLDE